ncbi:hypothetical protein D3C85_1247320 [compost metagenome]
MSCEALHDERRRCAIRDPIRQRNQHLGGYHTHVGIGALRPHQITDPISDFDIGHARPHSLDDTDSVRTQAARQLCRVIARTVVDIDEIDCDVAVSNASLSRPRFTDLDVFITKHFGSTGFVKANSFGHLVSPV